jgi:hypothetical protein
MGNPDGAWWFAGEEDSPGEVGSASASFVAQEGRWLAEREYLALLDFAW